MKGDSAGNCSYLKTQPSRRNGIGAVKERKKKSSKIPLPSRAGKKFEHEKALTALHNTKRDNTRKKERGKASKKPIRSSATGTEGKRTNRIMITRGNRQVGFPRQKVACLGGTTRLYSSYPAP